MVSKVRKMAAVEESLDVCGFCLEKLALITSVVRILSCEHSFCHSCLEENQRLNNHTICPNCRKDHGNLILTELQESKLNELVLDAKPSTSSSSPQLIELKRNIIECFACKGRAKSRCIECEKPICASHLDEHQCDAVCPSGTNIAVFPSSTNIQRPCPLHSKEVVICCKKCLIMFCMECFDEPVPECFAEEESDIVDANQHNLCSLAVATNAYREATQQDLVKASESIEKLLDDEKEMHKELDELEERGRRAMKVFNDKISQISPFLETAKRAVNKRVAEMQELENLTDKNILRVLNVQSEGNNSDVSYAGGLLRSNITATDNYSFQPFLLTEPLLRLTAGERGKEVVGNCCVEIEASACRLLELGRNPMKCIFSRDDIGLIDWLGRNCGARGWTNPAEANVIRVASDGVKSNQTPLTILSKNQTFSFTQEKSSAWISIDFGVHLIPTFCSFRVVGQQWYRRHPQNWLLLASEDSVSWLEVIKFDSRTPLSGGTENTCDLRGSQVMADVKEGWRYFRLYFNDPISSQIVLGEFEIYGNVTAICGDGGLTQTLCNKLMKRNYKTPGR